MIVDRYLTAPNDSYSLGATKIFLRENLGTILETERRNIQEFEVVKLQQHVRGYLARKRYLRMKESALRIQSAYRGYKVRAKYQRVRKGIVAMQAVYRMRRQKSIYGEMKVEMIRRKEIEAEEREARRLQRAAQRTNRSCPHCIFSSVCLFSFLRVSWDQAKVPVRTVSLFPFCSGC